MENGIPCPNARCGATSRAGSTASIRGPSDGSRASSQSSMSSPWACLYSARKLPWVPDLAADQRLGGYLAVVLAEAFLVPALAVLVVR